MNQSSFDCIFRYLLATPNSGRGALHGRDAYCTIDEHRKSVSVAEAGRYSGPATSAGRAAAP
jgi:hypothetical protein